MTEIIIHGQDFDNPADALAHFGVKGMKWGKRKAEGSGGDGGSEGSGGQKLSRKDARATVAKVSDSANTAIQKSTRAGTKAERKAAAKEYEEKVLKEIESPAFKEAYLKAGTMGKGEMAVHAAFLGPVSLLSIPATRALYKSAVKDEYEAEINVAHNVLRELRQA